MHHAVTGRTIPKGVDDRLVTIKDPEVLTLHGAGAACAAGGDHRSELPHLRGPRWDHRAEQRAVRSRHRIIQDIFEQLDVDDASHAFYLGKELARASLAVTLGKTYRQEGALSWGYLTPPDDARAEHVRLTERPTAQQPSARTAVIVTELTPAPDPVALLRAARRASVPNLSRQRAQGNAGHSLARYSFLTADPVAVVRSKGAATERLDLLNGSAHAVAGDALAAVQSAIAPYRHGACAGTAAVSRRRRGLSRLRLGRDQLERLPTPRFDDLAMPDVVMGIYDWVIAWDHDQSRAWLISTGLPETSATAARTTRVGTGSRGARARWRDSTARRDGARSTAAIATSAALPGAALVSACVVSGRRAAGRTRVSGSARRSRTTDI